MGSIQNGGIHPDEAFVLNGAGMNNGRMTHGHVISDDGIQIVGKMDDTIILDIAPHAHSNPSNIAA